MADVMEAGSGASASALGSGEDGPGLGRSGRMSRPRKRDAVLRLLRGEDLERVSRSLGVTAATLSGWRDAFLAGGEAALATKPADAMSRTVSPAAGRRYGLARVARVWGVARSTVYRRRRAAPELPRRRPGPVGPMPDAELLEAIRAVLAASPFHGEGHRKVWARLRHAGVRTSRRRVLRLMRENDLLAPTRVGSPRGPRGHDGTIIPDALDVMWGTDLTTTITGEGQAAVFIAIDHCAAECVGIHAAPRAPR